MNTPYSTPDLVAELGAELEELHERTTPKALMVRVLAELLHLQQEDKERERGERPPARAGLVAEDLTDA